MAESKNPEVYMPEPGGRNHIALDLQGDHYFEYNDATLHSPILVHSLSIFADMCIVWGPDAEMKDFDARQKGAIASLGQLPEYIQTMVKEALDQFPESQTP